MAQVDPHDDEVERFVVHRYAYDPARRERRNMIVAAFPSDSGDRPAVRHVEVLGALINEYRRAA